MDMVITRLFDTYEHAMEAVSDLEASGVPHNAISLIASNADNRHGGGTAPIEEAEPADAVADSAGTGASVGTVLGGGAGLLAGLGSLAIPGVGPIVAAGWLIATLTGAGVGAAAGGLVGSLTGAGVSEADAQTYQQHINEGGTLVTARVDDAQAAQVEQMMSMGSGMTGSTMTRPSSYAVPDAMTGPTTVGTSSAGTIGAAVPGETTAQRDVDTGLTR